MVRTHSEDGGQCIFHENNLLTTRKVVGRKGDLD